jgi:hypothetical protein
MPCGYWWRGVAIRLENVCHLLRCLSELADATDQTNALYAQCKSRMQHGRSGSNSEQHLPAPEAATLTPLLTSAAILYVDALIVGCLGAERPLGDNFVALFSVVDVRECVCRLRLGVDHG